MKDQGFWLPLASASNKMNVGVGAHEADRESKD